VVNLFVLTFILHFRNQGSSRPVALFNFVVAMSNLPDRTLIFVSSTQIEMATLGSFSMDRISLI
jgi:hypothetical protein